ncbi:MAG: hypothetical protein M3Y33_10850 [Actinomycetota bacterium]|nr:hypothetical protein [Actinomycetota bacterium]
MAGPGRVRAGGWYANDLLDNFACPSVREIVPELQHIAVGQWLPMVLRPSAKRVFVVDGFAEPPVAAVADPDRYLGVDPTAFTSLRPCSGRRTSARSQPRR